MFSWHETTLRGLCRLAFGLLVVVPTCAVLLAVVWCRTPLSVEYYRRALAADLALDVRLDRVSFPGPSVTLYKGLSLTDPETARPLARFGELEWRTSGQKSLVTCRQAELLDSSRLDLLAELIARRLRRFAGSKTVVEIQSPQLTLRIDDGAAPQTLTDVHGQLLAEPSEPRAQGAPSEPQGMIEFHVAGQEQAAPARISFYRTPSRSGAAISTKIDTGPTPLPSRLIELCCPGWKTWGPNSMFCGELWWQQRPEGLEGGVRGRVTGVELGDLVSTRSEHRLSGPAEVQLKGARFQHGRLLDATGSIYAGPGVVGRSLLAAAATQLEATGNNPAGVRGDQTDYRQMAVGFAIDPRGLVLRGLCPQSPGAIFLGPVGPLLVEPARPQPLLAVVRLLATPGEAVPADPAAQSLLSVLPVPAAVPGGFDTLRQAERERDLRR